MPTSSAPQCPETACLLLLPVHCLRLSSRCCVPVSPRPVIILGVRVITRNGLHLFCCPGNISSRLVNNNNKNVWAGEFSGSGLAVRVV